MKIKKISTDMVWEMIWKAWDLIRVNYPLTIAVVFSFFLAMILGAIPYVGVLISSTVGCLAPFVFTLMCSQFEKGEKSSISQLLKVYDNKTRFNALFPLVIINFFVAGSPVFMSEIPFLQSFSALFSLLTLPITIITNMAFPILFFNYKKVDFKKSILLAVEGLGKNIVPFIIGVILITVLTVLSTILLVLPLFFIAFPVIIGYNYLWYRVVYEDLVIEVKDEGII